ncbi:MAG: ATP phosphoribosyltransferase [Dehalococcoidia bacterium]|nr:ATP phosphoribosyltransferase [Dehalococcoidia bacterium]
MEIKVALPKGRLLGETAALLRRAGWGLIGYHERARFYHTKSRRFPNLSAKVFHEKDIPIQVAIGNYDLGICGSDWIEELLAKYPSSGLLKEGNLGYGEGALYMAASRSEGAATVEEMRAKPGIVRIASEYPNLAESFALNLRLRRFSIFPLWGAAEVYPPESADLALAFSTAEELLQYGLAPVSKILSVSAFLIANRNSWESKDMGEVMASLQDVLISESVPRKLAKEKYPSSTTAPRMPEIQYLSEEPAEDIVQLALPDGHQQSPTLHLLSKAGIHIDDYPSAAGNRRPTTDLSGVTIKVIRPQDMPLQVANGNFDLAITGRDWLMEHLYQFPSSPVTELLDLKLGKVKIVAVVSKDLSVADVHGLRQLNAERAVPLRVASEYINIADKYARDNHLGLYRVVPTWGASEAFLPEDADLLIENTQTGRTIARHNLKIIDTLFASTAWLIGSSNRISSSIKRERIKSIIETLRRAVEEL